MIYKVLPRINVLILDSLYYTLSNPFLSRGHAAQLKPKHIYFSAHVGSCVKVAVLL